MAPKQVRRREPDRAEREPTRSPRSFDLEDTVDFPLPDVLSGRVSEVVRLEVYKSRRARERTASRLWVDVVSSFTGEDDASFDPQPPTEDSEGNEVPDPNHPPAVASTWGDPAFPDTRAQPFLRLTVSGDDIVYAHMQLLRLRPDSCKVIKSKALGFLETWRDASTSAVLPLADVLSPFSFPPEAAEHAWDPANSTWVRVEFKGEGEGHSLEPVVVPTEWSNKNMMDLEYSHSNANTSRLVEALEAAYAGSVAALRTRVGSLGKVAPAGGAAVRRRRWVSLPWAPAGAAGEPARLLISRDKLREVGLSRLEPVLSLAGGGGGAAAAAQAPANLPPELLSLVLMGSILPCVKSLSSLAAVGRPTASELESAAAAAAEWTDDGSTLGAALAVCSGEWGYDPLLWLAGRQPHLAHALLTRIGQMNGWPWLEYKQRAVSIADQLAAHEGGT